jgi:adenine-specific DNA-methyltransferase
MSASIEPEATLARLRPRAERQRLGQFFTPEPLAKYLTKLLMRSDPKTVLDPAVGGGQLLRALPKSVRRFGIDVDPVALDLAKSSLPADVELAESDFLDESSWPFAEAEFDGIIANPPYIRHHKLSPEQKACRNQLNDRLGITLSALADYYVYFFCEAVSRLNSSGTLVFLTPALFLEARYGDALKELLLREGTIDQIIVFDHHRRVFADAVTAAAVTVFTRQRSRRLTILRDADFNGRVQHLHTQRLSRRELQTEGSWKRHLLSRQVAVTSSESVRLGDIVGIRRGLATGSNSFFCLSERDRLEAGIPRTYLRRVLVSGRNLPERAFTLTDWGARLERGDRVWLLWCSKAVEQITSKRVRAYVERGEEQGVHLRTTCRANKTRPWYAVENVDPPDFVFTYMSKRPLRFIENRAAVHALTALLGASLKPGVDRSWACDILLSEAASSAVTATAHDLGDGLRKIEPRHLADVEIPLP